MIRVVDQAATLKLFFNLHLPKMGSKKEMPVLRAPGGGVI
jgi:hypothetical protein